MSYNSKVTIVSRSHFIQFPNSCTAVPSNSRRLPSMTVCLISQL
nr:MAG TPA: hypothetical protein [Caudoviricetes sp.]